MGTVALLEDKYQLVLRAIERFHAGIALVPDAEVLELGEKRRPFQPAKNSAPNPRSHKIRRIPAVSDGLLAI
ncbi:hypothetical protein FP2506_16884 [Fulvimarina pelagi HTCC2506]|uniref:Uncharacterized protein n=1 Tax=Fulvimarina pelagi HTCC2506 TaxID=314231 RepID=Q0G2Q3_9HYPH|nr:hypothetical protein FP2506_16884 [Fulvimarina pelagi HTCC2506]